MFAAYDCDGKSKYIPHRDNVRRDGQWLNDRCLTAILYLNADWREATDGGELKIYPEVPLDSITPAGQSHAYAPMAGTIAIFKSELLHEVVPSGAAMDEENRRKGVPTHRFALTMWACGRRP